MSESWAKEIKILIPADEIQAKVRELGARITEDYRDKKLVVVGVLRGCFFFMADLCREIKLPIVCDFLGVSSYGDRTKTSGVIRITSDLTRAVVGKDVLLVEDIVDTGMTLSYLVDNLRTRKANSFKVCALLEKPARRKANVQVDYKGFEVPDKFVIGYGLDYKGRYRNLPYIGTSEMVEDD